MDTSSKILFQTRFNTSSKNKKHKIFSRRNPYGFKLKIFSQFDRIKQSSDFGSKILETL
ncbi:hypothetical protein LEP1GSC036_3659 [Leptospira weilii str. 2006001853]|uniref:Uncharacterized protein n=3 Tax=Leptospira weilii TaxID=28184 RepID=A0A828Z2U9_9LEPT|nr:hypothetical protein LEP1GSC036_3659 [Leptospira weilii str. 2006001853]EMJ66955.1 hypothetical protein LEP1GSC051_1037 [Leptospira sp. P2653]EMN45638.1 hypothetical protein LEP1GSC086_2453 [Leptospira weilii str. LNT 1234]EMN88351.1 hypothetical protein LEP1GSC108_1567 [Leptospira weilii str. UI 13098]EMY16098.1 hypothetical protein LEP1GSC043_1063 [Leptospira weilii str. Ecochallenge]